MPGWRHRLLLRPRPGGRSRAQLLFGESPGTGFVVSGSEAALRALAERIDLDILGTVGGDTLDVTIGDAHIVATLAELREAHSALAPLFP